MLPIGNLTVFLSVPPSYQYLHSPFTTHISPIHSFTFHHSPFAHSPFAHSRFTHSLFIIHLFTTHHSLILPLFFWSSSEKHPFIRRAPEGLSNNIRRKVETRWSNLVKRGQVWTNLDNGGHTWTKVVRTGQTWTNMDKHGQRWTNQDKGGQNWSNNAG